VWGHPCLRPHTQPDGSYRGFLIQRAASGLGHRRPWPGRLVVPSKTFAIYASPMPNAKIFPKVPRTPFLTAVRGFRHAASEMKGSRNRELSQRRYGAGAIEDRACSERQGGKPRRTQRAQRTAKDKEGKAVLCAPPITSVVCVFDVPVYRYPLFFAIFAFFAVQSPCLEPSTKLYGGQGPVSSIRSGERSWRSWNASRKESNRSRETRK
jgi:hypothetical protein